MVFNGESCGWDRREMGFEIERLDCAGEKADAASAVPRGDGHVDITEDGNGR